MGKTSQRRGSACRTALITSHEMLQRGPGTTQVSRCGASWPLGPDEHFLHLGQSAALTVTAGDQEEHRAQGASPLTSLAS